MVPWRKAGHEAGGVSVLGWGVMRRVGIASLTSEASHDAGEAKDSEGSVPTWADRFRTASPT